MLVTRCSFDHLLHSDPQQNDQMNRKSPISVRTSERRLRFFQIELCLWVLSGVLFTPQAVVGGRGWEWLSTLLRGRSNRYACSAASTAAPPHHPDLSTAPLVGRAVPHSLGSIQLKASQAWVTNQEAVSSHQTPLCSWKRVLDVWLVVVSCWILSLL